MYVKFLCTYCKMCYIDLLTKLSWDWNKYMLLRRNLYTTYAKGRQIVVPHLSRRIMEAIEQGNMTVKTHPGKVKVGTSCLPNEVVLAMKKVLKDTPFSNIKRDAEIFTRQLLSRQLPATSNDLKNMNNEKNIDDDAGIANMENLMKRRINAWYPLNYTLYVGKQYMVARMAAEYAALNKIFAEIVAVFPEFKPHSLFDFGSGVGTVTWVARKYWQESLQEYFNVDSSSDMNELAKLILKGGDENTALPISGVYYRQFLPATSTSKYSLVVSSYSLFELPSPEIRLQTLSKLWNKTENFLIIVEPGTKLGFKLINEARDFIIQSNLETDNTAGVHVFSPCTHEFDCPLSKMHEHPCRYRAPYVVPAIARNMLIKNEFYSYVVLKKGRRPSDDLHNWPRVIASPIKRKKHSHCRLCTTEGKLTEIVFTKQKHGLTAYHLGRSSKLGDRLPFELTKTESYENDGLEIHSFDEEHPDDEQSF